MTVVRSCSVGRQSVFFSLFAPSHVKLTRGGHCDDRVVFSADYQSRKARCAGEDVIRERMVL